MLDCQKKQGQGTQGVLPAPHIVAEQLQKFKIMLQLGVCLTLRDSQVTETIHVDGGPLLKTLLAYFLSIYATAFTQSETEPQLAT